MSFKNISWNSNVNAFIFLFLGILLLFFPIELMTIAGYLIAITLMLLGVSNLIRLYKDRNSFTNGDILYFIISIACLILSISIFIDPTWIIRVLNLLVGVILIISAVMNIRNLLYFRNTRTSTWYSFVILTTLIVILGILVILNPLWLASIITRLEGISLILDTLITIFLTKKVKKVLMLKETNN